MVTQNDSNFDIRSIELIEAFKKLDEQGVFLSLEEGDSAPQLV